MTFQFTLPCRERRGVLARGDAHGQFQFTLPCRERQIAQETGDILSAFQFTLPCRERQTRVLLLVVLRRVSIHAPV